MNAIDSELLQATTVKLVAEMNPTSVYLFGSYAWGTPTGDSLTRYAIAIRYPTDPLRLLPDVDEFSQALSDAQGLFSFVVALLPDAVQP